MALFTNWANRLWTTFNSQTDVQPVELVMSNADGTPDILQSDGIGGTRLGQPKLLSAITPSDSTDITTLASQGLFVGGAGNLIVRTVGAPSVSVTLVVQAGTYIPGQFTRVMAASTVTGVVGFA